MKTGCPICKIDSVNVYNSKEWILPLPSGTKTFRYFVCRNCEVLYADPIPTPKDLEFAYSNFYNYKWFRDRVVLKKLQGWHRFIRIKKLLIKFGHSKCAKEVLLDIGSGAGHFLAVAAQTGWKVEGIEPSFEESQFAFKVYGLHVLHSRLDSVVLPREHYSVITMWHMLEHVSDPGYVLSQAVQALHHNGLLIIAVPNRKSLASRVQGLKWGWSQEPYFHIFHFSKASLLHLLSRFEMNPIHITSRDTWDNQFLGDVVALPIQRVLGLIPSGGKLSARIYLFLTEGLRLLTYSGYLLLRYILPFYEQRLLGSELLVVGKKR